MKEYLQSCELVSKHHIDAICDYIGNSVLDSYLETDPDARVAVEVQFGHDLLHVTGEITSSAIVDISLECFSALKELGCKIPERIISTVVNQSPDISQGVTKGQGLFQEIGAGDQTISWAMAVNETPEMVPMGYLFARNIINRLEYVRENKILPFLRPDGKTLVTIKYEDGKPVYVDAFLVSTQHDEGIHYHDLRFAVIDEVIKKSIPPEFLNNKTRYYVNPTGRFVTGGIDADSGAINRKIACNSSFGGYGRNGGNGINGKDCTKMDKSGTLMARYICKNIVHSGLADKCEIQIAYGIGMAQPLSVYIDFYGTAKCEESLILKAVDKVFDMTPEAVINAFNLRRPIYRKTTNTLFGVNHTDEKLCDDIYTWERVDKADALTDAVKRLGKGHK